MHERKEGRSNSLEISYNESFEKHEMKDHFHNSNEIIYIVDGRAKFKINDKIYTVASGDIIFISNLEHHELEVTALPYKRYFILIKPDDFKSIITEPVLASIFKHRPEHFEHVIHLDALVNEEIQSLICRMYKEYTEKKDFAELVFTSCLHLIFVTLYRNYTSYYPLTSLNKPTSVILEIQKYIDENYTEEISLAGISKIFYSDMYYISHLFKKVTGFNFKDYLILQRISKAKDLLYYTSDDITAIGMNSGFNNVNHFIRIFKKYAGTTPLQYRRLYSKKN